MFIGKCGLPVPPSLLRLAPAGTGRRDSSGWMSTLGLLGVVFGSLLNAVAL